MDSSDWVSQMHEASEAQSIYSYSTPRDVPSSDFESYQNGQHVPSRSHSDSTANAAQATASHSHDYNAKQDKKGSKVSSAKNKKNKGEDTFTLDEFWYTHDTDWSKLKLSGEESKRTRPRRTGMAGCATAPDCYTCGTKLNLDEVFGTIPCRVCGCFN